jgi:hypothetical protein
MKCEDDKQWQELESRHSRYPTRATEENRKTAIRIAGVWTWMPEN